MSIFILRWHRESEDRGDAPRGWYPTDVRVDNSLQTPLSYGVRHSNVTPLGIGKAVPECGYVVLSAGISIISLFHVSIISLKLSECPRITHS